VNARVQPEVADQLLRAGKTLDVTDRRHDADGHHHVDPRDRHEPLRMLVRQGAPRQVPLDHAQIFSEPIVFPRVSLDRVALVRGEDLRREPCSALWTEEVRCRAGRNQMRMQDGLHDVLQTRALAHQLVSSGDLPAQRSGLVIRHPDLRQEPARVKSGQHRRIDAVGLDLGVRDQPHLLRIGDHHATDVRAQDLGHRRRIPGRLDHYMIVMGQRSCKCGEAVSTHLDPTKPDETSPLKRHRFREDTVDIQSNGSHPIASFG